MFAAGALQTNLFGRCDINLNSHPEVADALRQMGVPRRLALPQSYRKFAAPESFVALDSLRDLAGKPLVPRPHATALLAGLGLLRKLRVLSSSFLNRLPRRCLLCSARHGPTMLEWC